MQQRPLAAIIIPAYIASEKRLRYLSTTLQSLVRQPDALGIVVDDDSPLGQEISDLVEAYDERDTLRYVRRSRSPDDRKTSSNALNYGIDLLLNHPSAVLSVREQERLSAVAYLHSDDLLALDSVAERFSLLRRHDFAYTNLFLIDEQARPLRAFSFVPPVRTSADGFPHHTLMWSKDFLAALVSHVQATHGQQGLFDPFLECAEDRDATLSTMAYAREVGATSAYSPRITYLYRVQPESITGGLSRAVMKQNHTYLALKHQLPLMPGWYARLTHDLPWSLLTYLPHQVKEPLRDIRDYVKGITRDGVPSEVTRDDLLTASR